MEGRPTLQSVAARASVSRQTVSNVLNSPHLVHPETLERVMSVIDEVGYRPNGAARQLRTRRSHVIGLRLQPAADGINGAVLDRFLHAFTEQAQLRGYHVMLFTAPDDHGEIVQYAEMLDTLDLDAFVLTSTHHADPRTRWLAEHAVPFVTFGRPWETPDPEADVPEHAWVDVDGSAGTRAAVEHLIELGHERIAYVGWPTGSDVGDDRRLGWRRAMRTTGLPAHELDALEAGVEDGVANGTQAAVRLQALAAPTAFVCASDSLALGVLAATRTDPRPGPAHGGTWPSVVGFDDTPVARAVGLTSVAQPLTEAAAQAVTLLLSQFSTPTGPGSGGRQAARAGTVLLNPNLVVRESTGPPAADR